MRLMAPGCNGARIVMDRGVSTRLADPAAGGAPAAVLRRFGLCRDCGANPVLFNLFNKINNLICVTVGRTLLMMNERGRLHQHTNARQAANAPDLIGTRRFI